MTTTDSGGRAGELLDVTASTWSARVDVMLIIALAVPWGAALMRVIGSRQGLTLGYAAVLIVMTLWRYRRLGKGVEELRRRAEAGRVVVRVHPDRRRRRGDQPMTLTIADGRVVLQGRTWESWPAASVTLGREPVPARGVELLTPSGPRVVRFVPRSDPVLWLTVRIDHRAMEALAVAWSRQPTT